MHVCLPIQNQYALPMTTPSLEFKLLLQGHSFVRVSSIRSLNEIFMQQNVHCKYKMKRRLWNIYFDWNIAIFLCKYFDITRIRCIFFWGGGIFDLFDMLTNYKKFTQQLRSSIWVYCLIFIYLWRERIDFWLISVCFPKYQLNRNS